MSGSDAARLAAFHGAAVIESALANGWETLDRYGADRPRVEAALNELRAELDRRARRSAHAPLSEAVAGLARPSRDEIPVTVTESVAGSVAVAGAADEGQEDEAGQRRQEEEERRWRRALKPVPADVAGAEGYRGAVWPDGWGRYHVVAPGGERIGYAEQGGGVRARSWQAHAREGSRLGAGMPTRARAVAALVRRHRERTPATDAAAADGLPGWRLVQTLHEQDRHRYRLIDPGGRPAGAVERFEVAGRRLWRATGGDPGNSAALRWPVTPGSGDTDAIVDEDAWRTREAAVRALAENHAPELELGPCP